MTQFIATSILDTGLSTLANDANSIVVCSAAPNSFAQSQTFSLGSASLTPADFSSGFSGTARALTLSARTNMSATAAGTATHVVLVNTTTQTILLVSACTPQSLTISAAFSISPLVISAAISQS